MFHHIHMYTQAQIIEIITTYEIDIKGMSFQQRIYTHITHALLHHNSLNPLRTACTYMSHLFLRCIHRYM